MSIVSTNDINKYFSFDGSRCGFYKIIRITSKTVFYKKCILDKKLYLKNGILWMDYNSIHYYHYIEETEGDEMKILIKNFNKFTFHENIMNLYYRNYEIKDGFNDSFFCLDSESLENASTIKYNLLSLPEAESKIGLYDNALSILSKFLLSLEKSFKEANIKYLLNIIKTELFEENYRATNITKLEGIIDKFELMSFVKELIIHSDEDCPVCLTTKETHSGYYKCNHLICGDCFKSWDKIKKSCPICRSF